MSEYPNYYSITPATVRYDNRLKPYERLLFGEITALSNVKGYCYSTNKYFANLYQVAIPTISKWINHLKELGYLRVEMIKDGKEIKERHLYPIVDPINQNVNTPINRNVKGGINRNVKENNTRINNTSINNSSSTGNSNNAFELYQIHVGMLSGKQTPIFVDYVQKLGDEVVQFAINLMLDQTSRPNFNYLQKILMKYESLKVTTVEKAKEIEEQFKNKRQSSSNYNKRPQFEEKMPSWMKSTEPSAKSEDDNKNSQKDIRELMNKINKKTEKNKATKASEE